MSRDKIKELIEELQKPGTDKDGISRQIIEHKRLLGDATPDFNPQPARKSTRKSKKSSE